MARGRPKIGTDEEIIEMVLDGKTDGQIAEALGLSGRRAVQQRILKGNLRPIIEQRRAELTAKIAEAKMIERERIVAELTKIVTFDIRALFNENGEMLPPCDWPEEAGAAIQKIKRNEIRDPNTGDFMGYTVELQVADKAGAAKVINSMLGYIHKDSKATLNFKAGIVVVPAKDITPAGGTPLPGGGELMPRVEAADSPKSAIGTFTLRARKD